MLFLLPHSLRILAIIMLSDLSVLKTQRKSRCLILSKIFFSNHFLLSVSSPSKRVNFKTEALSQCKIYVHTYIPTGTYTLIHLG